MREWSGGGAVLVASSVRERQPWTALPQVCSWSDLQGYLLSDGDAIMARRISRESTVRTSVFLAPGS